MTLILNGTDNSATTPAVTGTDTDTGVYYPATNQVALATNGTQAMLVDSSQNVGIGGTPSRGILDIFGGRLNLRGNSNDSRAVMNLGDATYINGTVQVPYGGDLILTGLPVSLTQGQLKFPATQNPSSDANTLDDYEEGTWTPTLNFAGSSTGITYSYQIGYYTKVGRVVTVQCYVQFANKGSASGGLRIDGLPFTAISGTGGNGYCGVTLWANTLTSTVGGYIAFVNPNTTYILPYYTNTGTVSSITQANCNNTSDFMINATYVTNT
jgi:hypothetical protein